MAYGYDLAELDQLLAREGERVSEIAVDLAVLYLHFGREDDARRVVLAALDQRPGDERLIWALARIEGEDPPMDDLGREFVDALRAIADGELTVVKTREDTLELRHADGVALHMSDADFAGRPWDPPMDDGQRLHLAALRSVTGDELRIEPLDDGALRVTNAGGTGVVVERGGHMRRA
jgi:hypothetical protein